MHTFLSCVDTLLYVKERERERKRALCIRSPVSNHGRIFDSRCARLGSVELCQIKRDSTRIATTTTTNFTLHLPRSSSQRTSLGLSLVCLARRSAERHALLPWYPLGVLL